MTVAAGVTQATFDVTPIEDWNSVSESAVITVDGGVTYGTQTVGVSVTDNDADFVAVSANTVGVTEGTVNTITVYLSRPAAIGGQVVTLTSNTPSSVTVPVSVTIGAGVTTATFAVTAIEDANSVNETVSVGVNAGGYGVQTVVVNVTDNDADYLVVAPAAMSLTEVEPPGRPRFT